MDARLLDILCCPTTRQPLSPLAASALEALNRAIAAGRVRCADGHPQATPLAAALVTRDGRTVYRIDDGIPVLLADQAISATQFTEPLA